MSRDVQEPTMTINDHPGLEGKTYEHPAYGMIGASRVSGSALLVGSDFVHQHYVIVRIRTACMHRTLSRDWFGGRDEIVEVALSEAQWATFVSSLNCGDGVPCTIERVHRKGVPGIPPRTQEDEFHSELADDTARIEAEIKAAIEEVEGEIGASLSKAKRDRIVSRLRKALRVVNDEIPFAAKSFSEHMENAVEKAKVEVNAYVQSAIMRAGLQAIGEMAAPIKAIGHQETTDEAKK